MEADSLLWRRDAGAAAYSWPGNVRELRNMVERLMLLATDGQVDLRDTYQLALPHSPGGATAWKNGELRTIWPIAYSPSNARSFSPNSSAVRTT